MVPYFKKPTPYGGFQGASKKEKEPKRMQKSAMKGAFFWGS
jgi:hypothetical protein